MRKWNLLIGLCSIGLGGLMLFLSRNMAMFDASGVPGERFWPYGLAWLFIVLGLFQWIAVIKDRYQVDIAVDLSSVYVRRPLILGAMAVVFGVLLNYAGFLVSALLFIPGVMLFMNERRPWFIVLSTLCIVVVIYCAFTYLFNSPLPTSVFSES